MRKLFLLGTGALVLYGIARALDWYERQQRWTPLPQRLRLTWDFFTATGAGTPDRPIEIARVVFGYRNLETSAHPKDCTSDSPGGLLQQVRAALDAQWSMLRQPAPSSPA